MRVCIVGIYVIFVRFAIGEWRNYNIYYCLLGKRCHTGWTRVFAQLPFTSKCRWAGAVKGDKWPVHVCNESEGHFFAAFIAVCFYKVQGFGGACGNAFPAANAVIGRNGLGRFPGGVNNGQVHGALFFAALALYAFGGVNG